MIELSANQRIALKYYKSFSSLCLSMEEAIGIDESELHELRVMRNVMHMMYKKYDPKNSFDVTSY